MHLNHPELVHKHPAHLASPIKIKRIARGRRCVGYLYSSSEWFNHFTAEETKLSSDACIESYIAASHARSQDLFHHQATL